jgi:hypothetical protein
VPPNEPDKLSDLVRQLLLGAVDSFEKLEVLEVLLALHSTTGAPLALVEIAARAHLAVEQTELATGGLGAAGIIERAGPTAWRVHGESAVAVEELARAWATCRPAVLKIMTDRALARIRTAAARRFAEAFRLRKKDDRDDDG